MLWAQQYSTLRHQDFNILIILLLLVIFGWFCDLCRRIFDTYELSVAIENGQLVRIGNERTSLAELQVLWDTHMQQDLLRATETPTGSPVCQLTIPWSLSKNSIRMTLDELEFEYDSDIEVLAEICWGANDNHLMKVVDAFNNPTKRVVACRSKNALRKKKFGLFGVPYTAVDENEIELLNCAEPTDIRVEDSSSLRHMGTRWSEIIKFEAGRRKKTTIPCHIFKQEIQSKAHAQESDSSSFSVFPSALVLRIPATNQEMTLSDAKKMRSPPSVDHINEDRKLSSGCVIVHLLDRKRDRDSSCEHAGDSESLQVVKSVIFTSSAAYLPQEIYGEDDSVEEENNCVICLSEPKAVTLLPCRHFCVCKNCMERLQRCPVCRSHFTSYLKLDSPSPPPSSHGEQEQHSKPLDLLDGLDQFA